ncbi:extracellular catalytic domain type 1 short-chain-length polyhydroxyalkanoate depolymerase [Thalassotalea sp. PLHSN55]|uniref:extracellular catalytic domain type 1 short-chain-length polyhydroxyalkanoate depolymerase n=1 Tax=Thalassotalea sp. PLHSN55 TaxID=3435888 RepID=UPI003F85660C
MKLPIQILVDHQLGLMDMFKLSNKKITTGIVSKKMISNSVKVALSLLMLLINLPAMASFKPLTGFGDNPGELDASFYAKGAQTKNLVVLLHGCVQSGEALAQQSGFLDLAKQHNFALLVPQQKQSNNIKNCFNWFSAQDTNKDSGETLSLVNMINSTKAQLSSEQVFIVGLSAGGAMTSSLLVHYPQLFNAGAVIAGIPYPCADNLIKAISCMRTGPSQSVSELTDAIKSINNANAPWPKLSIWTGSNDKVVHPSNAQMLAQHWAQLNNLPKKPKQTEHKGYQISQWHNQANTVQVELIELDNIGHGIAVNSQQTHGGTAAEFVLESPLSSAVHLIDFWQIN